MNSEKLTRAVQLIKDGDKTAALPILKEVVQAEPNNESAWLWLYSCVEKVEQKKYCLQQALKINPNNQNARNALLKLEKQETVNSPLANREAVSPPQPRSDRRVAAEKPQTKNSQKATQTLLLGSLVLGVFCLAAALFLLFAQGNTNIFGNIPFLSNATFEHMTGSPKFLPEMIENDKLPVTIDFPVMMEQGKTVKLTVTIENNSDNPIDDLTVIFAGEPGIFRANLNYYEGLSVISTDRQVVDTSRADGGLLFFDVGSVNAGQKKDVFLNITANQIGVYTGEVGVLIDHKGLNGNYTGVFTTTVK